MSRQTRLKPAARKEDLLAAALPLAERTGIIALTRSQIAKAAGVTGPVVNYHFGTMGQLRRELMAYAIKQESLGVIAQGLIAGSPEAQEAPEGLRRRALDSVMR